MMFCHTRLQRISTTENNFSVAPTNRRAGNTHQGTGFLTGAAIGLLCQVQTCI